jgi:hypothetical protein
MNKTFGEVGLTHEPCALLQNNVIINSFLPAKNGFVFTSTLGLKNVRPLS